MPTTVKLTPVTPLGPKNECVQCGEDGRAYAIEHNGKDIGGYLEGCPQHARAIARDVLQLNPEEEVTWL